MWDLVLRNAGDASILGRLGSLFPNEDHLDSYDSPLLHKTVLGLNHLDLATISANIPTSTMNEGDAYNRTSVWWAATRGDLSSLSMLINCRADVNISTNRGSRPLDAAIYSKAEACVTLLIECGYNVDHKDFQGLTPLHRCCFDGASVGIMERLFSKGANIEACDQEGVTPLHLASQQGNEHLVRCLISHGANLDSTDVLGESPPVYTIQANASQTLRILLQHRADYTIKTKAGETLLHVAAQHADSRSLNVLRSMAYQR